MAGDFAAPPFPQAGDWHYASETMPLGPKPHMMRVMLISNLAVDQVSFFFGPSLTPGMQYDSVNKALHQRFANGTQVIEGKEAQLL